MMKNMIIDQFAIEASVFKKNIKTNKVYEELYHNRLFQIEKFKDAINYKLGMVDMKSPIRKSSPKENLGLDMKRGTIRITRELIDDTLEHINYLPFDNILIQYEEQSISDMIAGKDIGEFEEKFKGLFDDYGIDLRAIYKIYAYIHVFRHENTIVITPINVSSKNGKLLVGENHYNYFTIDLDKRDICFNPYFDIAEEHRYLKNFTISNTLSVLVGFLKMLSCKNIVSKDIVPVTTKKQRRRGDIKDPYKVLHVVLPRNKANSKSDSDTKHEISDTVNFRQGHFKTFTKEKPLFGKAVGTYWWQPIVNVNKPGRKTIEVVIR